jgi:hypothetical protein
MSVHVLSIVVTIEPAGRGGLRYHWKYLPKGLGAWHSTFRQHHSTWTCNSTNQSLPTHETTNCPRKPREYTSPLFTMAGYVAPATAAECARH